MKRNILANYVSQTLVALIGIIIVPLYVHILGAESYGLIVFLAAVNTWFSFLDLGLTPAITREVSRQPLGQMNDKTANVVRTIEAITFFISFLILLFFLVFSNAIAESWLSSSTFSQEEINIYLKLIGGIVALRFSETIFRGVLIGVEKQVFLSFLNISFAIFRNFGAVIYLKVYAGGIFEFFVFQLIFSVISLGLLVASTYQFLPFSIVSGKLSFKSLTSIRSFATSVFLISIMNSILVNGDRFALSMMVTVEELSYYGISVVAAGCLFFCTTPIIQAVYPRLCRCRDDRISFLTYYRLSSQLIASMVACVSSIFLFHSDKIFMIWLNDPQLVKQCLSVFIYLMVGNLFNCLLYPPYFGQLALDNTKLLKTINFLTIIVFFPLLYFLVANFGVVGASMAWCCINVFNFFFAGFWMHKKVIDISFYRWILECNLFQLGFVFIFNYAFSIYFPVPDSLVNFLFVLFNLVLLSLLFCGLISSELRGRALILVRGR